MKPLILVLIFSVFEYLSSTIDNGYGYVNGYAMAVGGERMGDGISDCDASIDRGGGCSGAGSAAGEMTSPPERLCASTHPAHIQSYPRRGVGCASGCGTGGLQQLAWKGAAHTKQDSSVCGGVGIAPHA